MESSIVKVLPGESDESYPKVFTVPPTYPEKLKYGQLDKKQFEQFYNEGYVLIPDFFIGDEMKLLEKCKISIEEQVGNLAQKLYEAGKITKLYNEFDIFHRLTEIEKEFPGASVLLHRKGVLPKSFADLWGHPKLLNVVEQLLGTAEIYGDPNWNLRCKTPNNDDSTVPWHQDNGYASSDAYNKMVITAWIPFLDTNERNGCMQVVKNGHRKGKVATHKGCWRDTWYIYIEEEEMAKSLAVVVASSYTDANLQQDVITCPVPYGGLLLFSNMLPHRSLNNASDDIRWSVDLRWLSSTDTEGYFGAKKGIQMRSRDNPELVIDWESFAKADRQVNMMEMFGLDIADLDPLLPGPWIEKWELVHSNKHTDAYMEAKTKRR